MIPAPVDRVLTPESAAALERHSSSVSVHLGTQEHTANTLKVRYLISLSRLKTSQAATNANLFHLLLF